VEVTDRRDDRQRHRRVDAGDRHQPLDLLARKRDSAERGIDDPQLLAMEIQLPQQRLHGELFIWWERLVRQPAASLDPEQISHWRPRNEVAVQDRLHLVLQPGALLDDVSPTSDLAAQRLRVLVGHPHPGR
jgi:hypothetical protein